MTVQATDFIDRLPNKWQPKSHPQKVALHCPAEFLLFGGAAGSLKHLALTTVLPTPSGWAALSDLRVGDWIFDTDGAPCQITAESAVLATKKCFEIEFDNGERIVASDEHNWLTFTEAERAAISRRTPEFRTSRRASRPSRGAGKKPWLSLRNSARAIAQQSTLLTPPEGQSRSTQELFDTQKGHDGRPNHSVAAPVPLQLPERALPIDPYVLGAWLGDGSKAGGQFSGADHEIVEEIRKAGYVVNPVKNRPYDWYIKKLVTQLRLLGVRKNKHIPPQYLRASHDQRLALLQGLMDTDGTANPEKGCLFYNTNKRLIEQVRELILTLGSKAELSEWEAKLDGRNMGRCYGISFLSPFPMFRLPRKLARQVLPSRPTNRRRYIVAVREVASVPVKCIAVSSPSHMFLVSQSFVPTHNSETILVDALKYHKHPQYRAIIFRKTYGELEFLIDRTRELYSNTGGRLYEGGSPEWRWPWGAVIEFRHMDKPKDVYKRQGPAYQYVAFDESTHQPEFPIRYLLNSRMRTTEGIPLRMRLATNPGNIGHGFHKAIFHGSKCTHCIFKAAALAGADPRWLKDSRIPFQIYRDALWPSDKVPINHSTCFIPGKLSDHTLLGAGYERKLRGLPKALQEALLEGCWEAFEGQYFDCFDVNRHVVPLSSVGDKEWWPHWVGIDYGFGHATAAYLFTKSPNGTVYTLDEYVIHKRKAVDVATDLQKLWGDHKLKAWFLSKDTFDHDGTEDFSRAEMMSQATGIYFDRAYNDRISGAMLMYQLLSQDKWFITENCPLLSISLASRVHADGNEEDVAKVTDDEDDAYDAARYGVASFINPGEKPKDEELKEKFENEWSHDPTVAMIQYKMWEAKQRNVNQPINYRPGRRR